MGDSFGHTFRITTSGESHGGGVGVVIDGCPAGVQIDLEDISGDLIISDAQNVYIFNEQLGIYNTIITPDSVENILVYYNK